MTDVRPMTKSFKFTRTQLESILVERFPLYRIQFIHKAKSIQFWTFVYSTLQKIKAIFGEKKSKKIHLLSSGTMESSTISIHSIFIVFWSFCQNSISNPFLPFWILFFFLFSSYSFAFSPLLAVRRISIIYFASHRNYLPSSELRIANDENIVVE